MNFEVSEKTKELQNQLQAFMDSHVYPNEEEFQAEIALARWKPTRIVEELKAKARHEGLWNLFLPYDENGAGLTNLEYAPLCEIMGRSHIAPEIFIVQRRILETWKYLRVTAPRTKRKNG